MEGPLAFLAPADQQATIRVHGHLNKGSGYSAPICHPTGQALIETLLRQPEQYGVENLTTWIATDTGNTSPLSSRTGGVSTAAASNVKESRPSAGHSITPPAPSHTWQSIPTSSYQDAAATSLHTKSSPITNRIVGFALPSSMVDSNADSIGGHFEGADRHRENLPLGQSTSSRFTVDPASKQSAESRDVARNVGSGFTPDVHVLPASALVQPGKPTSATSTNKSHVIDPVTERGPIKDIQPAAVSATSGTAQKTCMPLPLSVPLSTVSDANLASHLPNSMPVSTVLNPPGLGDSSAYITLPSAQTSLNSMRSCSLAASWVPQLRDSPPAAVSMVNDRTRAKMLEDIAAHAAFYRVEPDPEICIKDSDVCPINKCIGFESPEAAAGTSSPPRDKTAPARRSLLTYNILNPPKPPAATRIAGMSLFAQHIANGGQPEGRAARLNQPEGTVQGIEEAGHGPPQLGDIWHNGAGPSNLPSEANGSTQHTAAVVQQRLAATSVAHLQPTSARLHNNEQKDTARTGAPKPPPATVAARRAPKGAQLPAGTAAATQSRFNWNPNRDSSHTADMDAPGGCRLVHQHSWPPEGMHGRYDDDWTYESILNKDKVKAREVAAADAFASGMDARWFGMCSATPACNNRITGITTSVWQEPQTAGCQGAGWRAKLGRFLYSLLVPVEQ